MLQELVDEGAKTEIAGTYVKEDLMISTMIPDYVMISSDGGGYHHQSHSRQIPAPQALVMAQSTV